MDLTFEWEEGKAEENIRRHKISFEEAKTVFNDQFSLPYQASFISGLQFAAFGKLQKTASLNFCTPECETYVWHPSESVNHFSGKMKDAPYQIRDILMMKIAILISVILQKDEFCLSFTQSVSRISA